MALDANAAFTDRHRLRTVQIPNPGAGNPAVYQIAGNEVVQIVGVHLTRATGIGGVNRMLYMYISDALGANPIQGSASSVLQPGASTWDYWFSCGIAPVNAGAALGNVFDPLACGLQLQELEEFHISGLPLLANDTLTNIYLRLYQWKQD